MPSSLAALEAKISAPAQPFVALQPSGDQLRLDISFTGEPRQRARLKLASRSKPTTANEWEKRDMGSGGQQWSGLSVDANRKKKRCSDCTRPLPDDWTGLRCEKCIPATELDDFTWRYREWRMLSGLT